MNNRVVLILHKNNQNYGQIHQVREQQSKKRKKSVD